MMHEAGPNAEFSVEDVHYLLYQCGLTLKFNTSHFCRHNPSRVDVTHGGYSRYGPVFDKCGSGKATTFKLRSVFF